MKRLISIVLMCNFVFAVFAHDFSAKVGNATYYFNYVSRTNKTVEITWQLISSTGTSSSYRIGSFSSNVVVPSHIEYAGNTYTVVAIDRAYKGSNITSISFPETIIEIKDNAFESCIALTTINLNNSVRKIGQYAFKGCTALETIDMPNSVTELGYQAFQGCSSLRNVRLSNSITTCGAGIFDNCTSLQNVYNLPSTLPKLFFNNCTSLESVFLPSDITEIPYYLFKGCTQLNSIYYEGTSTQWDEVLINYNGNDALRNATLIFNNEPLDNGVTFENNGITYIVTDILNQAVKITNGDKSYSDEMIIPTGIYRNGIFFNVVGFADEVWEDELYMNRILYEGSEERWNLMSISEKGRTELADSKFYFDYDSTKSELNYLYLDNLLASSNSLDSVSLKLHNTMLVTGFQFELEFPEGIMLLEDIAPYLSTKRTTTQKHGIFDVRRLSNGRYLFVCSSMSNSTFSGSDGEVAVIPLRIAESVQDGDYACILHNIAITDANANVERITKAQYILNVLTINTYRLSYMVDGIEYAYDSINNDSPVVMRPEPTLEGYTFSGWNKTITTMPMHNDTIYGTFSINQYQVSFTNYDGAELQSGMLDYGTMPAYTGATPIKPATAQYTYQFAGWSPEVATVSGDAIYTGGGNRIGRCYLHGSLRQHCEPVSSIVHQLRRCRVTE